MGRAIRRRTVAELAALSVSTHFDFRLADYDLVGSIAHVRALRRAELIDDEASRVA